MIWRRNKMIIWIGIPLLAFVVLIPGLLLGSILKNGVPLFSDPGFSTRISTYLTTNVAATEPGHSFPELEPRTWEQPPDDLFDLVTEAVNELGWETVSSDQDTYTLNAVVTTRVMQYKDDISIEVRDQGNGNSEMILRSASRVGQGDLGANLSHILSLYKTLDSIQP